MEFLSKKNTTPDGVDGGSQDPVTVIQSQEEANTTKFRRKERISFHESNDGMSSMGTIEGNLSSPAPVVQKNNIPAFQLMEGSKTPMS